MKNRNLLSIALLGKRFSQLKTVEQEIIKEIAETRPIEPFAQDEEVSTFGERLADHVASFGGSWTFIMLSGVFLACWVLLNVMFLAVPNRFDPYPFIFLNLMLSMLAAVQAPIIMMSQNRQSAKDRLTAINDYKINLKAETEILDLHQKIDLLTDMIAKSLDPQKAGNGQEKP